MHHGCLWGESEVQREERGGERKEGGREGVVFMRRNGERK